MNAWHPPVGHTYVSSKTNTIDILNLLWSEAIFRDDSVQLVNASKHDIHGDACDTRLVLENSYKFHHACIVSLIWFSFQCSDLFMVEWSHVSCNINCLYLNDTQPHTTNITSIHACFIPPLSLRRAVQALQHFLGEKQQKKTTQNILNRQYTRPHTHWQEWFAPPSVCRDRGVSIALVGRGVHKDRVASIVLSHAWVAS